ncbi:MAG: HlyD family efflux transporter periplasmic adaptor subunit [Thermoflexales bacterium]
MRWPILRAGIAALALAACAPNTPQPLPTIALDAAGGAPRAATPQRQDGVIAASGVVAPAQEIRLAFMVTERIKTVKVTVGDAVKTGQVLAELDDTELHGQIRQAETAVAVAQAAYDLVAAGPTFEQILQGEAAFITARAAYSRTLAPAAPAEIGAASAALAAANARYRQVTNGPSRGDTAAATAALRTAEAALRLAQGAYDRAFARSPAGIGADPAALALEKATNDYNAAKAVYGAVAGPADAAALSAAAQQVAAASAQLDRLIRPVAVWDREQAQANLAAAQSRLDDLRAGARPEQRRVVEAQLEAATAALAGQKGRLQRYALVAPMNAVVVRRAAQPGETAVAGTPVLVLADLERMRVETIDLSERDAPKIAVGQAVTVFIKAMNQSVPGRVSAVAPLADTLGGDVVYKTTIELDSRPAGLRAGMTVDVQFGR